MKSLEKSQCPHVLRENSQSWTAAYVRDATLGRRPTGHWGHKEIRSALADETERRCAYCEARVAHVAYEHVEHIKPKSLFPQLAHEWENLTTACPRCNAYKGAYWDALRPALNPYVDQPHEHITFIGNLASPCEGSERGEITLRVLRLNRLELAYDRMVRLLAIFEVVLRWREATGALRDVLEAAIKLDVEDGEYPTATCSFLSSVGFPVAA